MQRQRQLTQWVKVTIPGLEETKEWQQSVIIFEPGTLNPESLSLGNAEGFDSETNAEFTRILRKPQG